MLDTIAAEKAVFDLLTDQATRTDHYVKARQDFAHELVAVMADLIRSGTVTGTVTTTGSATTQTGPLTGGKIA
ncbi:hypothetical protein GKZ68_10455 [Hymenobacter sp. BRD128]|uniref:hypothetical protein n=1 Tax=Hymenobacter sp. BRD128 TaxID=2675878 RepID=UPI001566ECFC|nr:hypothetical protein [Hymenobacter sp. BRD128]QKG57011.1 hypothetical protein GKZ68_10455 [Hymenobacter sp. BRD128]